MESIRSWSLTKKVAIAVLVAFIAFFLWALIVSARTSPLVRKWKGHGDWVESIAFSPDGRLLASGSWDGTVKLWRVSDGRLVRTLTRGRVRVRSIAFSPDGRLLAAGTGFPDGTIKVWRVRDGKLLCTRRADPSAVWAIAFSPDGHFLASGGEHGTLKLWRVRDGKLLKALKGHTYPVLSIAFSPDGRLIASGSSDPAIKFWLVSDGKVVRTLKGHSYGVFSVTLRGIRMECFPSPFRPMDACWHHLTSQSNFGGWWMVSCCAPYRMTM